MWLEVFKNFLSIALELTAIFISVSFLISLIQGVIPYNKMEMWMEKKHPLVSAFFALVFAFVTPFCSCSTIPIVVNLLSRKVRFGIVMVFLFSSPVLDPTILTLMTAVLGYKVAIAYTVITSILSVLIGFALEKFGFETQVKPVIIKGFQSKEKKFDLKFAAIETLELMKTVSIFNFWCCYRGRYPRCCSNRLDYIQYGR